MMKENTTHTHTQSSLELISFVFTLFFLIPGSDADCATRNRSYAWQCAIDHLAYDLFLDHMQIVPPCSG